MLETENLLVLALQDPSSSVDMHEDTLWFTRVRYEDSHGDVATFVARWNGFVSTRLNHWRPWERCLVVPPHFSVACCSNLPIDQLACLHAELCMV